MDLKCKELVLDIPWVPEPAEWPQCCIYRVPKKLRKVNKEAYTPRLIAIGPLHHCKKELMEMEMQKQRYLRDFCFRTGKDHRDLASIIEGNEVKIRHCYAETSRVCSKEYINMVLLDAVFIIELFLKTFEKVKDDYILSKPWLSHGIKHDLLLLENQLPYFVLEDLYTSVPLGYWSGKHQIEGQQIEKNKEFLELSRNYFDCYDQQPQSEIRKEGKHLLHFTALLRRFFCSPEQEPTESQKSIDQQPQSDSDIRKEGTHLLHFTDLLRRFFCSPKQEPSESQKSIDHLYSATKLEEAGVQFKAAKNRHLIDINFEKKGCLKHCPYLNCSWLLNCLPCFKRLFFLDSMQPFLEIPPLLVADTTECVFRNVMALEQCHYPTEAYICSYILLLDYLINTEKDVDLLVEKKVVINQLGSDEAVATLVNKLGHEIVELNSCYYKLSQDLNEHYDDFWNRNMATLTTVYFRDIWRGTATVVGIVFLFLTVWNIFIRHFVKLPQSFSRAGLN
ncbi:hypothetical protein CJ030_MR1G014065 [Morella rubra]|uniref:Uncharacterized protein n=1 Tax=Morella rubra TaxID=262757 RepID=A0A6A1WPA7_9ROSI|nr:hypothetical protein CJ030_MR1G014065 [Morella rubra]